MTDIEKSKKAGVKEILSAIVVVMIGLYFVWPGEQAVAPASQTDTNFELTESGVKSLSPDISSVRLIQQVMSDKPEGYAVEIEINREPTTANNEWNYISQMYVHRLGKLLFEKTQVARLRMAFKSPGDGGTQWYQVRVTRDALPANWRELTYHQFFSMTEPDAHPLQMKSWLCKYYQEYASARPHGSMPEWCAGYADGRFD